MKRLRLQNSMLVAMVGANLFSGLSSDDAYRAYRRSHCAAGQIIVVGTDGVWKTAQCG